MFKDKATSGPILNNRGEQIGTHKGIVYYTVGQRKGIGISDSKPLYVVKKDKEKNAIIVGGKKDLFSKRAFRVTAGITAKAETSMGKACQVPAVWFLSG